MKKADTFAEIEAGYERLAAAHLVRLKERFEKLSEIRRRCDDELLILADDIENHGVPHVQRKRRSRGEIPECGTESGYQRHRHLKEKCDECRVAHRDHERIANARRKLLKLSGAA